MASFLNMTAHQATGQPFYVFFAPLEDVRSLAQEQDSQDVPPTLEWGGYKGYVLGMPDYSFIFRFREPSSEWEGSPANAPCFDSPLVNEAIKGGVLGEWLPEIYADDFDSFDDFVAADHISAVTANQDWPSSA